MNKNLQNKLFEDFPEIFSRRNLSKQETAICHGIGCGDGWYPLIYNLCETIKNHVDYHKIESVQVDQIKSKFSGLRFYLHKRSVKEISAMIAITEKLSYHICQHCGLSIFKLKNHECRSFNDRNIKEN
jgi:hypothetical protein